MLGPPDVLKIKPMGLKCAVLGGADIIRGLNREAHHPKILDQLRKGTQIDIPDAALKQQVEAQLGPNP